MVHVIPPSNAEPFASEKRRNAICIPSLFLLFRFPVTGMGATGAPTEAAPFCSILAHASHGKNKEQEHTKGNEEGSPVM